VATSVEHRAKAEHNEAFVGAFDLDATPFLDWAVTGVFYAALHYLRALAARHAFGGIRSYGEMDRLFSTLAPLRRNPGLYRHYRFLKDESREARYEMRRFAPREVRDMIAGDLAPIRALVLVELR
jgi:hypothetical protein